MKTTGGFKLWQIIYPIGIYYVVSSLMYFVLGLFLGDGQQTYMLRQLICSAATIPATMSFYKQDKIAEQVVYGTEKEKLDTKWLTDAALAVVFRAGIHPEQEANTLTKKEIAILHREIIAVLGEAVEAGGTTIRTYQNALGDAGNFQVSLMVYGQNGESCPKCGAEILKKKVAQRGTHYCPHCQIYRVRRG